MIAWKGISLEIGPDCWIGVQRIGIEMLPHQTQNSAIRKFQQKSGAFIVVFSNFDGGNNVNVFDSCNTGLQVVVDKPRQTVIRRQLPAFEDGEPQRRHHGTDG